MNSFWAAQLAAEDELSRLLATSTSGAGCRGSIMWRGGNCTGGRRALIETDLPFAAIAARNGYALRTFCSQSFKKLFGLSAPANAG